MWEKYKALSPKNLKIKYVVRIWKSSAMKQLPKTYLYKIVIFLALRFVKINPTLIVVHKTLLFLAKKHENRKVFLPNIHKSQQRFLPRQFFTECRRRSDGLCTQTGVQRCRRGKSLYGIKAQQDVGHVRSAVDFWLTNRVLTFTEDFPKRRRSYTVVNCGIFQTCFRSLVFSRKDGKWIFMAEKEDFVTLFETTVYCLLKFIFKLNGKIWIKYLNLLSHIHIIKSSTLKHPAM